MYISNSVFTKAALTITLSMTCFAQTDKSRMVREFALKYPATPPCTPHPNAHSNMGSTHEITYNHKEKVPPHYLWLTGQKDNAVVRLGMDGHPKFYDMAAYGLPPCSGPHGIEFDDTGQLWVGLEFAGRIVRFSVGRDGSLSKRKEYDVQLNCDTCPDRINTHPHGMAFASDGKTLWYTGKATGTIGKITLDGKVVNFDLPTAGSVPIYIKAGPDGNMWFTELAGNMIGRITAAGDVKEYPIPTHNSRPIEIVAEPGGGQAMWFTEEAGNKVGRIGMDGKITEFPVPKTQNNVILAGLAFDSVGNLWVQQYIDVNTLKLVNGKFNGPVGSDYIIKIDKSILTAKPADISNVAFTFYELPTRQTVMHRIIQGPDRNIWFTEMMSDKVGRLMMGK
jgi:virginiamycin B lyase